jgi:hypothetical protein
MKILVIISILFNSIVCLSQDSTEKIWKVIATIYDSDGELDDRFIELAKHKNSIDAIYLKDRINYFGHVIPETIRDTTMCGDTLRRFPNKNRTDTNYFISEYRIFNNEGYLIEHYNSGCIACSWFSYKKYYEYENGKLTRIINYPHIGSDINIIDISYNKDGSINQLTKYESFKAPFKLNSEYKPIIKKRDYVRREIQERIKFRYK